jgi:spore coat polysaccharide biosynthesis predicted glycosyltransferase SpsG
MQVLFRAAGGPRRGFGHLVRSAWLARALEVEPRVSVRGGRTAARVARRLGLEVVDGSPSDVMERERPDLLVIDDPHAGSANPWCAAARRRGIPVASVHDLGLARCASDLQIDGSIVPMKASPRTVVLAGTRYAILNPRLQWLRARAPRDWDDLPRPRVLVTLGGGAQARAAWRFGTVLARRRPDVEVRIAGGFVATPPRRLPPNVQWVVSSDGLAYELAHATVVLVAGGVTLYEACCLGTPAVAVAVVPAQRPTIRAFAARGAAIDAGTPRNLEGAIGQVLRLLDSVRAQRDLSERASQQVDGRGAQRVATALRRLAHGTSKRSLGDRKAA